MDQESQDTPKIEKITTDSAVATITHSEGEPTRRLYVVVSEGGLFKNGAQINKGEEIALDDHTANNFIALGEVELK